MPTALLIVTLAVHLLLAAVPALAHHSFAEYDEHKPITLKGTITKIEWVNPHAQIHVDVIGSHETVVNWTLELGAPQALHRRGWKKTDLSVGTELTVKGYLAKDGSPRIAARFLVLPDGTKLSARVGPRPRPDALATVQLSLGSRSGRLGTPALVAVITSTTGRDQEPADPSESPRPVPAELPATLARVNGETIERWELEDAVQDFDSQSGHHLPAEWRDEVVRSLLDEILAEHLLAQEARARKLDVTETDVQARMNEMRHSFPDDAAFSKVFGSAPTAPDRLQQRARRSLQISKLLKAEIEPTLVVKQADIEAYYQENIGRFGTGARSVPPLAEARTQIAAFLASQQREEKTDAFIRQLKAQATVEIYVLKTADACPHWQPMGCSRAA